MARKNKLINSPHITCFNLRVSQSWKQVTKILATLFFLLAVLSNAYLAQERADFKLVRHTMFLQGRERIYFIYPPQINAAKATKPVVFVLHGGGGADAYEMSRRTGINAIADWEDFIVVYPYGVDGQWNDGRGKIFRHAADNTNIDDVGFISAIIDELIQTGRADPRRIYVVGLSNGGMMAYRLGIEIGHRLTAIAAIIANLPANLSSKKPVRPLPVLIMNGTADPMMPWNGGPVRVLGKEYGEVLSTNETVHYWLRANGMEKVKREVRKLEDRSPDDRSKVEIDLYSNAQRTLEVILYRVVGGGHNLPGGQTPDRPLLLGPKNMDINAMEEVWAFFKRHINETPAKPHKSEFDQHTWKMKVEQVGDPIANYLNVEFTMDGRYMVWFEGLDGSLTKGIVWHCGIDPTTGNLIPPDGRGFRAFESTTWARANPGYDADGPYYVGADLEGHLIMVRPTRAYEGKITRLPTSPDPRRRAIYPTILPDRKGGFVFFIQNERTSGAGTRFNGNSWVELQYLDIAQPGVIRVIERQETTQRGFAPMDAGFARWMRNRPLLTYGAMSKRKKIEVRCFDADHPELGTRDLIVDGYNKIDPYGLHLGDFEFIFAGIDAKAISHIYRRPIGQSEDNSFTLWKKLFPDSSQLSKPSLAQSHEPFFFKDRLYTVYQVNEQGSGFWETTFLKPGEIWLADITVEPARQWRVAPSGTTIVAEPEPLVCGDRILIFYTQIILEDIKSSKPHRKNQIGMQNRFGLWRSSPQLPRFALYRVELSMESNHQ